MQKNEKEQVIKELAEKLARATSVVVTEFRKIDVGTVNRLRKKLRDGGVEYRVLKNTLAKRAAKGTSVEVIAEDFVGPISVSLSYGDVVAPAKILVDFIKDGDILSLKSAVVDGRRTDAAGIQQLAKLPGLPELRAKILGLINQPAGKVVRTIAEPANALARVIKAKADKV